MVYKVDVNVGASVEKIISYLAESNKFNIFYNGKSLLIAYKKYSFYETNLYKKNENQGFNKFDYFRLVELTLDDASNFSEKEADWITRELVRLDTEKFEYKNQEEMRKYLKLMDKMEEELSQEVENIQNIKKKKGGCRWRFWKKNRGKR